MEPVTAVAAQPPAEPDDDPTGGPAAAGPAAAATGPETGPAGGGPTGPAGSGAAGSVSGTGILAVLALAYLVAMLRSAQATIAADSGALAITTAAYALPGVVSAILVAGAALGLTAVGAVTRWLSPGLPERPGRRSAVALGAGLLTGLAAATSVMAAYGTGSASMVLAGTVAAAGTAGGAIAAVRARQLVAAGLAAALAVFAVGFVLNYFKTPLLSLYGFGDSEQSRLGAYGWFAMTAALGGGLAAGVVAFGYLRRRWRPPAGATPLRTSMAYLAAGAGPGMLLLLGELITRLGGARVLRIASSLTAADGTGQSLLDGSRVKYGLLVLLVGGITAMIAFGRTIRPPAPVSPR